MNGLVTQQMLGSQTSRRTGRRIGWRLAKWSLWGGISSVVFFGFLAAGLIFFVGSAVPKSFAQAEPPIPPPDPASALGSGLDGFASPYIGHTGSWDGKGGALFGASKVPALDVEVSMGLRWTFMCVYWKAMERDGPVDLSQEIPPAWRSLDEFVKAAQYRKLNILMPAPVVGGNAGGPPKWA